MNKGDRIKYLRELYKLTQGELAEKVSTTKQNIYKYENGIITNIPSDKVEALACALNTTPAYIMGWDEKTPAPETRDERTTLLMGLIEGLSDAEKDMIIAQLKVLRANRQTD